MSDMALTCQQRVVYKKDKELSDIGSLTFDCESPSYWPMKKLNCSVCHRRFHLRTTLNLHKKVHFTLKPYTCTSCFTQFPTKTLFQRHSSSHTNPTEPNCFLCKKVFSDFSSLKTHEFFMLCVKPFECNKCEMKFTLKAQLWQHQKLHKMANIETLYICKTCGKNFYSKATFFVHKRWHKNSRQLSCELCHQRFYLKSSVFAHKIEHSSSHKP